MERLRNQSFYDKAIDYFLRGIDRLVFTKQKRKDILIMPQLLDRSQVSTAIAVPLDLIEAETLSLLGVEIIDIEDNIDDCIPQGDIRYWVQRGETELLGGISDCGNRFDTPDSPIGSYATLFIAATSYLPRGEVNSAYRKAEALLTKRFASAPDYM